MSWLTQAAGALARGDVRGAQDIIAAGPSGEDGGNQAWTNAMFNDMLVAYQDGNVDEWYLQAMANNPLGQRQIREMYTGLQADLQSARNRRGAPDPGQSGAPPGPEYPIPAPTMWASNEGALIAVAIAGLGILIYALKD